MEKMLPFYNTPAGKKVFDHFVDVNVQTASTGNV